MLAKRWVFREVNRQEQMKLVSSLSISPITASVLVGRGVATLEQAQQWLFPNALEQTVLRDPFLLPDMEAAIDRLHWAVKTGELVCFYGDYDVDGMAATSLYVSFFRNLGCKALFYIPHRLREGYGLNEHAIRRMVAEGVKLLVTSDCGTTSLAEIELAGRVGLDVIVTDHHRVGGRLPSALAVLNPHRADSVYPFRGLCSAGLAYKVVQAYCSKYRVHRFPIESLLDLVALATIADIVPLQDENRFFVREGLALITRGARSGIRALKQVAGIERPCTSDTVAFKLAPRLNAAGRLDHAAMGVRLLLTESETEARELAGQLEHLNRERQRLEEEMTAEAVAVAGSEVPPALVLTSTRWHLGVVGIIAARLVERYHRPTVIVAMNDRGIGKGSVRGIPGFDVYEALAQCQEYLEGFGGHSSAAGLTIRKSCLSEFAEKFVKVAAAWSGENLPIPLLHVDVEVSLQDMVPRLIRELDLLHPFGAGNPEPTLATRNLKILDARIIGDRHLKLTVRQPNSPPIESIGFRMGSLAERGLSLDQPIDLAFMPELNRWNGLDRVQLRIRDLRSSVLT